MNIITLEQYLSKVFLRYGHRYDYSKSIYINALTPMEVICKIHGSFWTKPRDHLQGRGCQKCGIENRLAKMLITTDVFIKKAKLIHSNRYDYSKTKYISAIKKVIITCKIHGDFLQTPSSHLKGSGCHKCAIELTRNKIKLNINDFINQSNIIHLYQYDYSKTVITHSHVKSIITCKIHGDFEQTPSNHLRGQGCPICKSSKGEKILLGIFVKNNIKYIREYKLPYYNRLRYDFYLPDYNLLIEFHGLQHYVYSKLFHKNARNNFYVRKERDRFKKILAKEYGIKIIYFNYKHLTIPRDQFETIVLKKLSNYTKKGN